ncbi:hypothetical protein VNO80_17692 [Phaseolus coccineus]|uniref:Uncharacterized protein n=1 Tax=Phaseolus coccineus TaxID=3886 RepID=A0AAN9MD67_PHACN
MGFKYLCYQDLKMNDRESGKYFSHTQGNAWDTDSSFSLLKKRLVKRPVAAACSGLFGWAFISPFEAYF